MLRVQELWAYSPNGQAILEDLNLTFQKGRVYGLLGRSGSGKSTFLQALNGLWQAQGGRLEGDINYQGQSIKDWSLGRRGQVLGSVFQDPRTQFFTRNVHSELSFGCENYGQPLELIQVKVDRVGHQLGLKPLFGHSLETLSSGQQQLVACGSILALEPQVYLFDEPTANLDAQGIELLLDFLHQLKAAGHTLLIADHRLYWLMDLVDDFVYLNQGRLQAVYGRDDLQALTQSQRQALGLRTLDLTEDLDLPSAQRGIGPGQTYQVGPIRTRRGDFHLDIESLSLSTQGVIAVVGPNGAGKTSLIQTLYGMGRDRQLPVYLDDQKLTRKQKRQETRDSLWLMTNATRQLFQPSLAEEVSIYGEDPDDYLPLLGLPPELWDRHPQTLSGGEKQRAVIAGALASGKRHLYFDEPTSGLDHQALQEVVAAIQAREGLTLVVSHDAEFILAACHEVIEVDQGQVQSHYPLDAEGQKHLLKHFLIKERKSS